MKKVNFIHCTISFMAGFTLTILYMSMCIKPITRELNAVQQERDLLERANSFKKRAIDQFFIYMDNCEEMLDEMSQDSLVNFMDVYGEGDHYDMMVQARDSINVMLNEEL